MQSELAAETGWWQEPEDDIDYLDRAEELEGVKENIIFSVKLNSEEKKS